MLIIKAKKLERLADNSIGGGCHNNSCGRKNRAGAGGRLLGDGGGVEGLAGKFFLDAK